MTSATERHAYRIMQDLSAQGWQEESLLVDHTAMKLEAEGMSPDQARTVAQAVFDAKFKVHGGC